VKYKPIVFLPVLMLLFITSSAQIGGDYTYEFLNLTNSSRQAALGGALVPIKDNDVTLALSNPSIITPEMSGELALSFVDYYSDINYGFVSYAHHFEKLGSFVASAQYISYGETMETGYMGDTLGYFSGGENAIVVGWGRSLDSNLSIGANVKFISSFLHTYSSFGMAVDLSATFHKPEKLFTASLVVKNIGVQLKAYNQGVSEPLPFEIQVGISKGLKHIPFRYSIVYTQLQKFDLTYDMSTLLAEPDPFTGEVTAQKNGLGDKFMRHLVIGGEFMPTRNFSLRVGYNYRRRQEMKINSKLGTVGFSWGLAFRVSRFHFSYSRSAYHLVGSPNYITISTNLKSF
jgi:hypothetical protein